MPTLKPTREVTIDLTPPDTTELNALTSEVDTIVVDSPETKAEAAVLLVDIRGYIKTLKSRFDVIKKPLNDARSKLLAEERVTLSAPTALAADVQRRILAYDQEQEAERQKQIRKEQADALAKQQAARDAEVKELRDVAKAAPKPVAQKLRAQAKQIKAEPLAVVAVEAPPAVVTPGMSKRTTYDAKIVDVRALVNAVTAGTVSIDVLEPLKLIDNHPTLNDLARKSKGKMEIPGVAVVKKERLQ